MTTHYSNETTGVLDGTTNPPPQGSAAKLGGRIHALIATLTLAAQASGDDIVLGKIPKGACPLRATLISDVSLATATLEIGSASSAAKYVAATTLTATDTPTPGMKAAAMGVPTTAEEEIIATIGIAALPAAGNLSIIFEYTLPEGG